MFGAVSCLARGLNNLLRQRPKLSGGFPFANQFANSEHASKNPHDVSIENGDGPVECDAANGTCRIQNLFNGTYTIKEEGGKKILTVQRKKVEGEEAEDPIPDKYYIKSVTKDELILLLIDGGGTTTFWIFKRIK